MRKIKARNQFKRDYQKLGLLDERWFEVMYLLINDKPLPDYFRDHALNGEYIGFRDCHVNPDLVLIYRKVDDDILELVRIGSHSQLFWWKFIMN